MKTIEKIEEVLDLADSLTHMWETMGIELVAGCLDNSIGLYLVLKEIYNNKIYIIAGSRESLGYDMFHVWLEVEIKGKRHIVDISDRYMQKTFPNIYNKCSVYSHERNGFGLKNDKFIKTNYNETYQYIVHHVKKGKYRFMEKMIDENK
jgi:hypothetical protein